MDREPALLYAAEVRLRPILMTTLAMVFGMVPLAFALSEGSEQRAPMGQAVIGGVITSSLLTLVVVPVVYCYLDDFSRWVKRRVFRRPSPVLSDPARHEPAMNIEQARFNMIEQQIRTWEVLDQSVLSLLSVVKREDFVPPAYRVDGLRRHRGAAAERPVDARAQGRGAPAAGARGAAARARARDRRRLGPHGGAARAQGAARDDARDRSRSWPASPATT